MADQAKALQTKAELAWALPLNDPSRDSAIKDVRESATVFKHRSETQQRKETRQANAKLTAVSAVAPGNTVVVSTQPTNPVGAGAAQAPGGQTTVRGNKEVLEDILTVVRCHEQTLHGLMGVGERQMKALSELVVLGQRQEKVLTELVDAINENTREVRILTATLERVTVEQRDNYDRATASGGDQMQDDLA